jgi:hypothetical protein
MPGACLRLMALSLDCCSFRESLTVFLLKREGDFDESPLGENTRYCDLGACDHCLYLGYQNSFGGVNHQRLVAA